MNIINKNLTFWELTPVILVSMKTENEDTLALPRLSNKILTILLNERKQL